ncbi:hypothetical protein KUW18_13795 [Halomonas sp. DP5Y7-2]|uniref:lipopolysaccharide biosynthesis protein n=1 Tax=Halomonas sp. DP5Y7-2 TaxID=2859076 RepID=UPI001C98E60F|nr:hypothetical protein [Halomonas sp. DP5Y7-2]MBY5985165.1 hypothetical protein [Halomonas sp. DP5Y7-2]
MLDSFKTLLIIMMRAGSARAIIVVGSVGLTIFLGRSTGAEGLGQFSILQSIIMGAGIIATCGTDLAILKFASGDKETRSKSILIYALKVVAIPLVLIVVVLGIMSEAIYAFFNFSFSTSAWLIFTVAITSYVVLNITSSFLKARTFAFRGSIAEPAIIPIVALVCCITGYYASDFLSLDFIVKSYLAASALALFFSLFSICYSFGKGGLVELNRTEKKAFKHSAQHFFVYNIMGLSQSVGLILIVAAALPPADMGVFKAVERIVVLANVVIMMLNSFIPPKIAHAYQQKDYTKIQHLVDFSCMAGVICFLPVFLICVMFPEAVLSIFGEGFEGGASVLVFMVSAQMFNVATGPMLYLLNMTGHQMIATLILSFVTVVILPAAYYFSHILGLQGAAYSMAALYTVPKLILVFICLRKVKVFPFIGMFKRVLGS